MVIGLRPPQTLPLLGVVKVAYGPRVEVADPTSGMPEWIHPEVAPEIEGDPLKVSAGLSETKTTGLRGSSHSRNRRNVSSEQSVPWNDAHP
jgi:hypothetical protein